MNQNVQVRSVGKPPVLDKPQILFADDTEYLGEALAELDSRMLKNQELVQTHYDKAAFLLSNGMFLRGWHELEWRLTLSEVKAHYNIFPIQRWDGEQIAGKHVFLWLDQGIGDQIICLTMLPDLLLEAGKVTVYCATRFKPLLQRSFPGCNIVIPGELGNDFDQYDYQVSFSDLGKMYRPSFRDFPECRKLLQFDPTRAAELRAKYQNMYPGKRLIGVSWNSMAMRLGKGKSISLDELLPLNKASDVQYVNLQYEMGTTPPKAGVMLTDTTIDQLWDLDGFAAQVGAMDKVVSISNTTLHMAGAVGVETLGVLSRGGARNWYWFVDRDDCPWYASVRLVRQTERNEWPKNLRKIVQDFIG